MPAMVERIHDPVRRERWWARANAPLRAASVPSWAIVVLMAFASVLGLAVEDLYADDAWAREAFRGGDLVSLVVVVPLLLLALALVLRGSRRGEVLWAGALAYALYDYAYYVFGAEFNDVFLLHIALFTLSAFALACLLPNLDAAAIRDALRADTAARWVGGFLVVVGLAQGALWVFVVVRFAVTGELLEDIPASGQHLVFAVDLSLLVPALVVAGVLLFRRTAIGYVLGALMCVMGATYQLNLLMAGVYQDAADVEGVSAFPPEGIGLTVAFLIATAVVLRGRGSVGSS